LRAIYVSPPLLCFSRLLFPACPDLLQEKTAFAAESCRLMDNREKNAKTPLTEKILSVKIIDVKLLPKRRENKKRRSKNNNEEDPCFGSCAVPHVRFGPCDHGGNRLRLLAELQARIR
jgi:hypothetical protein